jgi:hypothetical protein
LAEIIGAPDALAAADGEAELVAEAAAVVP